RRRRGGGRRARPGTRARCARAARAPVERLGVPGHARARVRLPAAARPRACARAGRCARSRERLRARAGGDAPQLGPRAGSLTAPAPVSLRVLILSWEYPPLIEGGLARHVRKLSENLVRRGLDVHVLTRGHEESPPEEEMDG